MAISGASGLIGSALGEGLSRRGVEVVRMVRRATAGAEAVAWDLSRPAPSDALERCDAVVHLAGAPLVGRPWTEEYRRVIRDSRVDGTSSIARGLAGCRGRKVLIAASAVGYYGDAGEAALTEECPAGRGFLAETVAAWEAAAEPARAAGHRVVHLRLGMVLSARGGALPPMVRASRWGLGAEIGSGRQWMSWVALPDATAVIERALHDERFTGPVNLTAPAPERQGRIARELAAACGRAVYLRVPSGVVHALGGGMAEALVLTSQRVYPSRLEELGLTWRRGRLREMLAGALRLGE